MMQDERGKLIYDGHGKSSIQQEEGSVHQQTGLKFQEESSKMLHLEYNFAWCCKLDSTENRSEILGKFENLVLEKDREDQLD